MGCAQSSSSCTEKNDLQRPEWTSTKSEPSPLGSWFQKGEKMHLDDRKEWHKTAAWNDKQQIIGQLCQMADQDTALQSELATCWVAAGGSELEPALRSGAIALLDAQWLVNFARQKQELGEEGDDDDKEENASFATLPCRQKLPPEAFLSCDQVIGSTLKDEPFFDGFNIHVGPRIQIITLSYMWLHPQHPDPKGTTLRRVAECCQELLQDKLERFENLLLEGSSTEVVEAWCKIVPRVAIFWDYASLYQHPDPKHGVMRSPPHDKLFRRGLEGLSTLFMHPHTQCFKVTQFPPKYPESYELPPQGANCANYYDRGWPFVESCLVSLSDSSKIIHDISLNASLGATSTTNTGTGGGTSSKLQHRLAPLTPDRLWEKLQNLSFTNAKDDRPLVMRLYEDPFARVFSRVQVLDYNGENWGDEQIEWLAEVILEGYAPLLQQIDLSRNRFGPLGCQALANALSSSSSSPPPSRQRQPHAPGNNKNTTIENDHGDYDVAQPLTTSLDQSTEKGDPKVQDARHSRTAHDALQKEEEQAEGCRAVKAIKLQKLSLSRNLSIGDKGMEVLARVAVLQICDLNLEQCGITAKACKALAQAFVVVDNRTMLGGDKSHPVALQRLCLSKNAIGDRGAAALSTMMVLRHLEQIDWRQCDLGDDACRTMAATAAQCQRHEILPLQELKLGDNPRITDEGCRELGTLLTKCPRIQYVELCRIPASPATRKQLNTIVGRHGGRVKYHDRF